MPEKSDFQNCPNYIDDIYGQARLPLILPSALSRRASTRVNPGHLFNNKNIQFISTCSQLLNSQLTKY